MHRLAHEVRRIIYGMKIVTAVALQIIFMKNHISLAFRLLLFASVLAGILPACKNPVTGEQEEGFPQSSPEKNTSGKFANNGYVNFVTAAKAVTPGVVHIKTLYKDNAATESRFGETRSPGGGSGSGVVISSDGYIATNNHVVERASFIEVIFPDRRSFTAKIVGRDPNTDLALLKVNANNLPMVAMGNSDNVEVGEWVLAVGYPFSLNSTVTAGIISAKGRSIGIIHSNYPVPERGSDAIESFIQTDAAINAGNSGGALVDINGRLIGINTAIASLTGSYAGYAFAIPVNLAKKILDDLKTYGVVRRGILGISFSTPAEQDQYLRLRGINPASVQGVFITGIQPGSAADTAGLQEGDIIQSIDGLELFSSIEFSERIARHHPGDKITLRFLRNGKTGTTTAILQEEEKQTTPTIDEPAEELHSRLGANFSALTPELQDRYDIAGGILVTEVRTGGFFHQLGILPGTIIVFINGRTVNTTLEINEALQAAQNGMVQILGIAPDGSRIAFNFSFGA